MTNKKRLLSLILASAIIGGLLAGCSSNSNEANQSTSNVSNGSESTNTGNSAQAPADKTQNAAADESQNTSQEAGSDASLDANEPAAGDPASSSTEESKPSTPTTDKPEDQSSSKPVEKPAAKPAPKPTEKPAVKPTPKPTPTPKPKPEKPVTKPTPIPEAPAPKVSDLYTKITSGIEQSMTMEFTSDDLKAAYEIDASQLAEFIVHAPMINIEVSEIGIFKVKNKNDIDMVKAGIEKRAAFVMSSFEQYLPDQYEIAKNYKIVVKGNYVLFVISDKADAIIKAFNSALDK